jgi:4-hydroxy-3-methylbut-2-enyl diphosphate reductase
LAELAKTLRKPAYLIGGVHEMKPEWFVKANCVLVTAGASAPEDVVQECVDWLKQKYNAIVETRTVREEDVSFNLPKELRSLTLVN